MCNTCGCVVTGADEHRRVADERRHADHAHADHRPADHGHTDQPPAYPSHAHPGLPAPDGVPAGVPAAVTVQVLQRLLQANDAVATHNRAHLDAHGVLAINVMSSPGSGKTALLEATVDALRGRMRIGVIEGDLETENDARRIRAHGVPAVQITTGNACHLDAHLVHAALHELPLDELDLLFIENVGNLVCPAGFDLGEHCRVALLSVTEGDDKPSKYPVMFRAADLVALSKADLLGWMEDFDPARAEAAVRSLGRPTPVIRTAVRRAPQIGAWLRWLTATWDAHRARLARPACAPARA